jgi:hypothetical protein
MRLVIYLLTADMGLTGVQGCLDSCIFDIARSIPLHVFISYWRLRPPRDLVPPPILRVFMSYFYSLVAQAGSYLS